MSVNINRSVDDVFYRYKMPKITVKVEGKGNGIKTVIPNMVEIAKALGRPPSYPTKYFGIELGAQVQMDEKNERYIVNGAHDADRLQEILDGFISRFVLCKQCNNPETQLRVNSKKQIESKCIACGWRGMADNAHRLATYIVNHPPNSDKSKKGKGKKSRKSDDDSSSPDQAAAHKNVEERANGIIDAPPLADREIKDDDWSMDTSKEAVRAREEAQLTGAVSKLVMAEDADRPLEERLEIFHRYMEEKAKLAKVPVKEILSKANLLDCKEKGVMILVEFLLDSDNMVERLKLYQGLFQRFTDESKKTQKYLLGAIEKMIEKRPELLAKVPHIFMALYELDIVEEPAFNSWGEKVSKKYVSKELSTEIHKNAAPFLKWLSEAEEEEAEEDEDEEEDEIDFDEYASAENGGAAAGAEDDEDEDDLDIDDI